MRGDCLQCHGGGGGGGGEPYAALCIVRGDQLFAVNSPGTIFEGEYLWYDGQGRIQGGGGQVHASKGQGTSHLIPRPFPVSTRSYVQ